MPVEEADITGNWHVMGLCSTASYDYRIDSIVPEDRTVSFVGFTKYRGGPAYNLGVLCITEVGHAGWVLGVTRRAIDEATALAETKQRMTGKSTLADDPRFQYDLAEAESLFRAGDLWIRSAFNKAEQSAFNDNIDQAAIGEALQATAWFTQQSTQGDPDPVPPHRNHSLAGRRIPALLPRRPRGQPTRHGQPHPLLRLRRSHDRPSPRLRPGVLTSQGETLVRSSPMTISPSKCAAATARHSSYCSGWGAGTR